MKFVVDRRTWYRGKGPDHSYLLDKHGKRCCIGFVGAQSGVPDAVLLYSPAIQFNPEFDDLWPTWLGKVKPPGTEGGDRELAYSVNDNPSMGDTEREAKLQEIFSRNGDEIAFEN